MERVDNESDSCYSPDSDSDSESNNKNSVTGI